MKIQPTLLILFTLLISSVFSIVKLRSDAHATQQAATPAPLAQDSPQPARKTPSVSTARDGQALLNDVHLKLVSQSSIRARLLQTFHEKDKFVIGRGEYLQAAPMRLKYTLEMEQEGGTGKLIQVCDSNILWSHQEISPIPSGLKPEEMSQYIRVTRRNVKRILDEIRNHERIDNSSQYLMTELGMGGLPALFASLSVNMDFGEVQEISYNETPCYVLTGTWTQARQQEWDVRKSGQREFMTQFRPAAVEVWVDQRNLFPMQIRYLRKHSGKLLPLFTLAFEDVRLGEPVDPSEFVYTPPTSITPTDTTREFLDRLMRQ
ncbi:hypothetical protein [Lacunimicrobium album]